MLNDDFKAPARELIVDPVLEQALVELGDAASPELDQARFDLYLQSIERAREQNAPFPDLPWSISDACDRVVRLSAGATEGYAGLHVPRDVILAQLRLNIESASRSGDRNAALYGLAAFAAVKERDLGAMLAIAARPPGVR